MTNPSHVPPGSQQDADPDVVPKGKDAQPGFPAAQPPYHPLDAADVVQQPPRWQKRLLSELRNAGSAWLGPFAVALGAGYWLIASVTQASASATAALINLLLLLGLDPERSLLVGALVWCLAAALAGTLVGWRKDGLTALGALGGALAALSLAYLVPFILREMQPTHDPGGALEPLNLAGLARNVAVIFGLGGLAAFVGMSIGRSLRRWVLLPCICLCWRLSRGAWQIGLWLAAVVTRRPRHSSWKDGVRPLGNLTLWAAPLGALAALSLVFLSASHAGPLLWYTPDEGIHLAAPLPLSNGSQAQSGRVISATYPSPALGGQQRQMEIYLPPLYNDPHHQEQRYPVLYVLHGTPGSPQDWFTGGHLAEIADQLIARHQLNGLILVSPDGRGRPGTSPEWGNSADGRQRLEDSLAFDLVPYIDHHYRTIASARYRAIGGLSSGGFGAMNIASHHPDLFSAVISLGGYYQAEGSIWGSQLSYRQENSPSYNFPHQPADWTLAIFLGAADQDQPYYADTLAFGTELSQLRVAYQLDVEHGAHAWAVWTQQMWNALLWLHGMGSRW